MIQPYFPNYGSPIYLGTGDPSKGVMIWDTSTDSVSLKGIAEGLSESAIYNVNCSTYGSDGKFYLGCGSYGFYIWDGTSFVNKTTANGLVNYNVTCMTAGPNGKIYIGTYDGISVWDGSTFSNSSGIPYSYIVSIAVGADGMLYCTHGSSVVTKYDPSTNTQTQIATTTIIYEYARNPVIASNGKIYFLFNYGVYEYVEGQYNLNAYPAAPETTLYTTSMIAFGDKLYITGQSTSGPRFFIFDTVSSTFSEAPGYFPMNNATPAIGVDSSGVVYFPVYNEGVYSYNQGNFSVNSNANFIGPWIPTLSLTISAPPVQPTNVKIVGSVIVGDVTVNPTSSTVYYNGTALPVGSVLRDTVTGVKYMKKAGGDKAYYTILTDPNPAWGLDGWE